jgi:hypothetical protein
MRIPFVGRLAGLVVLGLAVGSAGCDTNEVTTPTTPTNPTLITETFTGAISPQGAATFPFSVSTAGGVSAVLRSITPSGSVQLGLALGTWNGLACQVVLTNDQTTAGMGITGATSAAGSLCVRLFDVGQMTQSLTFEITVIHP